MFKSVAFGGFDKQDVVHYIERTAREAAEAQEKLQRENEGLLQESQALGGQVLELRESRRPWRRRTPSSARNWPGRLPGGRSWRPWSRRRSVCGPG